MHGKDGEDVLDLLGLENPEATEMMPGAWYGVGKPSYFGRVSLGLIALGVLLVVGAAAAIHARGKQTKQDSDFTGL